ncbi:Delta-like protein, partial [Caligus rogercresseyi]
KRRMRRNSEQIRVNADAARENELNAVNSYKKSKMLDDHMIVNSLDFPKQKRINTNIADEESFSAKDGSIVYKQMMRDDNKRLNSEYKKGGTASENLLSYNEANRMREGSSLNSKFDRSTSTLCSGASNNSS